MELENSTEDHLYFLRVPALGALRPGRTDNLPRRLQEHQRRFGEDVSYALQALGYAHLEPQIHRHFRACKLNPDQPRCELLDASKIDLAKLESLIRELHRRFLVDAPESPDSVSLKRRQGDYEADLADRAAKRHVMEADASRTKAEAATLQAHALKTAAEAARIEADGALLRRLVESSHGEAIAVFLRQQDR